MGINKTLYIIITFFALSACSPSVLQVGNPEQKPTEPTHTETIRHYFWGAIGTNTIDAEKICTGNHLNSIETSDNFVNGILNFFTGGIYMPVTYSFYCNAVKI